MKIKSIICSALIGAMTAVIGTIATPSGMMGAQAQDMTIVGMGLPCKRNDNGFCQAHHQGLLAAIDSYGVEPRVIDDSQTPEDWVNDLTVLATDANLVIGVGAQFDEAGKIVAAQFPDVKFVVINGSTDPGLPNLHVYGIRQGVPAFIAGVVAAKLPDAKVMGFVGGLEIPPTIQSDSAVRAAAEGAGLKFISTITGDFNDVPKAKAATASQLAEGANVIYGMLDAGRTGMVQAASESGKNPYLIGTIFPTCDVYDNMVGTAIANSANLVKRLIKDAIDGTLATQPQYYGVEDQSIQRFELCPNFNSADMQALVDATTAGVIDGSIPLPDGV